MIVSGINPIIPKQATSAIPIVGVNLAGPIQFGLAATYSRPGGNVSGILNTVETLPGKLVEIAREVVPNTRRLGLVLGTTTAPHWEAITAAAGTSGLEIVSVDVTLRNELEPALHPLTSRERWHCDRPPKLFFVGGKSRDCSTRLEFRFCPHCTHFANTSKRGASSATAPTCWKVGAEQRILWTKS